jgi:outer membrane protein assembly factor BamB
MIFVECANKPPLTAVVLSLCVLTGSADPLTAESEWSLADAPVSRIEIPDNPRTLPYRCLVVDSNHSGNGIYIGDQVYANLDDDEYDEIYSVFSCLIDSNHYHSALLVHPHDLTEGETSQHNGPFLCCRIHNCFALDVMRGPGEDIVLTRHHLDTLVIEVVSCCKTEGLLTIDTAIWFPAAIATGFPPRQYWHSIHLAPLAAFDANGDGTKELIYSRSVKPDSAIERSIVAYDLSRQRVEWTFPVADMVSADNAAVFWNAAGDSCLAMAIHSTGNKYATNGMTSREAYVLALDVEGKELWRRRIGGAMFSPVLVAHDVDDDGYDDVCVSSHPDLPEHPGVIVRAYNPLTGKLVATFRLTPGQRNSHSLLCSHSGQLFVFWRDEVSTWVARLGTGLKPTRLWMDDRHDRPTIASGTMGSLIGLPRSPVIVDMI